MAAHPDPQRVDSAATPAPAAGEASVLPAIRVRGRSFMALILAPEPPFAEWFAQLDTQMRGAAGLFAERPVVADLSAITPDMGGQAAPVALEGLAGRGLKLIGVEGVRPAVLAGTRWEHLPTKLQGRSGRELALDPPTASGPIAPSLLIDRPVRSGQSIVFEEGDVTVIGALASGAEVIAGGSIHVYGPLRGRAIAGLRTPGSRIFCRKLEAEMVGVEQLYRTAEHWGPELHGRAVQVRCDRGALRLSALV